MNDRTADAVAGPDGTELSDEINRMMGSVWLRHTGERPNSVSTELGVDKIRCVIEAGPPPAPTAETDAVEASPEEKPLLSVSAQRGEAIEVVRRATHRRVVGFITKRDEKAGTSTQTFVLDGRRVRN